MNKLLIIFILGLIIRFLIIPFTIHPDFRAVNLAASLISTKGELFTFYDHISKLPRDNKLVTLYGDNLFIYPPLAYIFHAPFHALLSPIYPKVEWELLINDIGKLRTSTQTPLLLILLKLPYLVVDLIGFFILYKLLPIKSRLLGVTLWWLNPISLYVSYGIGQFDIVPAVLILSSILISPKKPLLSAILLGLSAGFKPFPLVLLPFLPGNKLKNCLAGGLTYLLIILPFLSSPAFKMYALFADQSSKLLYAKVFVSATQYISIFLVLYILLLVFNFLKPKTLPFWAWPLSVLLLFYSITNFHPQWFLWVTPLLIISWLENPKTRLVVVGLVLCYIAIIFSFEPSLHFGLFGLGLSPYSSISRFIPTDQLISWIRSIFAALSAFVCFLNLKNNPTKQ